MNEVKRRPTYWKWFWITVGVKANYYPCRGGRAVENQGAEEQYKFYVLIMTVGAMIAASVYFGIGFLYFEPRELFYTPALFAGVIGCFAAGYIPYKVFSKYREIEVEPELEIKIRRKVKVEKLWVLVLFAGLLAIEIAMRML